ncbi:sensor histidine kinase [Flagellimonas marinaquae]|uniref:sensor histidine kinase n=1 Tax=Flagellimonas marinaquae TaxID=254955 RepID=UPI002074C434|nr:histidine kinase [Allomuricauda aquimarina]USD25867.1 histidine kinase [Allomuricauda aquimarina]
MKWIIIVWLFLGVLTLSQLVLTNLMYPGNLTNAQVYFYPLGSFITGVLLLYVFLVPIFDYSVKYRPVFRFFLLALHAVLYVVLYLLLIFLFDSLVVEKTFENYGGRLKSYALVNFNNILKNYLFQVTILYVYEFIHNLRHEMRRKQDLETKLEVSKLQVLKYQLQPHFLFNSLNSVVSILEEDIKKAQDMLINLSDFLRMTLNSDFNKLVPLSLELDNLQKYMGIEKIRFEDQLEFILKIDEGTENVKVPILILQPIVENAIKHGFKGGTEKLTIAVEVETGGKKITIRNNGARLTAIRENFGLTNVKKRLKHYSPNRNSFRIYQEGGWVVNELILP